MSDLRTYYQILGVDRNATKSEIKSAFRALAKLHHPDKNSSKQDKEFGVLVKAYQTLIDDSKRSFYDLTNFPIISDNPPPRNKSRVRTNGSKQQGIGFEVQEGHSAVAVILVGVIYLILIVLTIILV